MRMVFIALCCVCFQSYAMKNNSLADQLFEDRIKGSYKSKSFDNLSVVESEDLNQSVRSHTIDLREQLLTHQNAMVNIFDLQEKKIVELEKENTRLRQIIKDKDVLLEDQKQQIALLTKDLEDMKTQNRSLNDDISQQTLSLQEALLREKQLTFRMSKQAEQIEIIRKAAEAFKNL